MPDSSTAPPAEGDELAARMRRILGAAALLRQRLVMAMVLEAPVSARWRRPRK